MSSDQPIVAYIDYRDLCILAKSRPDDTVPPEDWEAMRRIWEKFNSGRIKLVTSGKDTGMDIILWLNTQGCCVTDTMWAIEAVEDFEYWGKPDKNLIDEYRRVLEYYDMVDMVGEAGLEHSRGGEPPVVSESDRELIGLLFTMLSEPTEADAQLSESEEAYGEVLKECLGELQDWYDQARWYDLRKTDYDINWEILESVLTRHGQSAAFSGPESHRNRKLFGLLNRAVGLCKKSCPRLPASLDHIEFLLKTVTEKYLYSQKERDILHLFTCIRHGVHFFIHADRAMIKRFDQKEILLHEDPLFKSVKLLILSPSAFAAEVLAHL
jgi:hypothetical protein